MRYIIYDVIRKQVVCDTDDYDYAVLSVRIYITSHEDVSWVQLFPVDVLGTRGKLWKPIYRAHELNDAVKSLMDGELYNI